MYLSVSRVLKASAAAACLTGLGFLSVASPAFADEACTDFKWDVTAERALFAGTATPLVSGAELKSAPLVLPNHLYQLQLMPQDQVSFVSAPGRATQAGGSFAGILRLKVSEPGSYRVSIDTPFWIDVVSNGALLPAKDFQGQHGCSAPHKIVEFDLRGSQSFVLQMSAANASSILLTITRATPRKL
jgi:hypothetical protein